MNAQKGTPRRPAVHQLHVNDKALGLMIDAIAKLSHEEHCFATLSDVLVDALRIPTGEEILRSISANELQSLVGEHKVFVRIPLKTTQEFEMMKKTVGAAFPGRFGMREAVCYCCMISIAKK